MATKELGGRNYVFWGGREGYETLLNTDMKRELEQMARFFRMAVDYAKQIGFDGQFLIEPKPKEPTKHQYDFDAAAVLNFLRTFDLWEHFKLNIEANHATLAGHTFEHELTIASIYDKLGSIDANVGDALLGWDTDQFLTDPAMSTRAMLVVLKQGGLGKEDLILMQNHGEGPSMESTFSMGISIAWIPSRVVCWQHIESLKMEPSAIF